MASVSRAARDTDLDLDTDTDTDTGARGGEPGWWRRFRWPALLVLGLVAVAVAGVLARAGGNARALDPDGVSDGGSRALAVLLADRGVAVQRVATVAQAAAEARGRATIFLPLPARLRQPDVARLPALTAADLVLVAPEPAVLAALAPEAEPARSGPVRERRPACDAPAALRAGAAEVGGQTYTLGQTASAAAVGCYPAGGGDSLVLGAGGGRVTVIGTSRPFTNEALGHSGNAALALGLLGAGDRVVWLLPRPGETSAAPEDQGLIDLLPDRLLLALAQGAFAVLLLALWQARRLGGVVAEPLPVLVRGTESTEGRARLYQASGARASAADALRAGARRRLAASVGLGPDPAIPGALDALTDAVAARTGRPAGAVADLLHGAEPADSAALVRLANDLDILAAEVRRQ